MNTAKFLIETKTIDPDTGGDVHVSMFKHNESGGIFGIDTSFICETFDDDEDVIIADPFNQGWEVKLFGV